MTSKLDALSDNARVWVYKSSRPFTENEVYQINDLLTTFVSTWNAHSVALTGVFEVVENWFIVLAVDEDMTQASGCSIDSSVRFIAQLEDRFDVDLRNRTNILVDDNGALVEADFNQVVANIKSGAWPVTLPIYDTTLTGVETYRNAFKVAANESWMARLL